MNRDRYIADLRTLADLLERNPSLPLPASMPGPLPVAVVNISDINLSRDEIETLREAVRTIVAEDAALELMRADSQDFRDAAKAKP